MPVGVSVCVRAVCKLTANNLGFSTHECFLEKEVMQSVSPLHLAKRDWQHSVNISPLITVKGQRGDGLCIFVNNS
jgi:hypothetical protein